MIQQGTISKASAMEILRTRIDLKWFSTRLGTQYGPSECLDYKDSKL